jgi:hypothetical protein
LFVCFFGGSGLDSGPHASQAGALTLEPLHQPFFVLVIFEIGSCEPFARADFEPWSSWVARITGMRHQPVQEHFVLHSYLWDTGHLHTHGVRLCFPSLCSCLLVIGSS